LFCFFSDFLFFFCIFFLAVFVVVVVVVVVVVFNLYAMTKKQSIVLYVIRLGVWCCVEGSR